MEKRKESSKSDFSEIVFIAYHFISSFWLVNLHNSWSWFLPFQAFSYRLQIGVVLSATGWAKGPKSFSKCSGYCQRYNLTPSDWHWTSVRATCQSSRPVSYKTFQQQFKSTAIFHGISNRAYNVRCSTEPPFPVLTAAVSTGTFNESTSSLRLFRMGWKQF